MAKYMMFAFTNPIEGREAEYNDWYDNVALPVYRSLPGLKPLGRYKLAGLPKAFSFEMDDTWQYMSMYEFTTDDPKAFLEKTKEIVSSRTDYYFSDAIDKTRFYEPVFVALQ